MICKSDVADFKMRIFNADASEAKMCGNGSRCIAKYVYGLLYTSRCVEETGVGGIDPFCAGVNAISTPPGEYGRKVETQRNWGARTSGGVCGLIRRNAKNLTKA